MLALRPVACVLLAGLLAGCSLYGTDYRLWHKANASDTEMRSALNAWRKENGSRQLLLSDFRRQMLPAYGAMVTKEDSPVYRYAKRAFFIIDKTGTVKFAKVMDNSLDLLSADEVLKALKDSGA